MDFNEVFSYASLIVVVVGLNISLYLSMKRVEKDHKEFFDAVNKNKRGK